jgi:hypothetical protein
VQYAPHTRQDAEGGCTYLLASAIGPIVMRNSSKSMGPLLREICGPWNPACSPQASLPDPTSATAPVSVQTSVEQGALLFTGHHPCTQQPVKEQI